MGSSQKLVVYFCLDGQISEWSQNFTDKILSADHRKRLLFNFEKSNFSLELMHLFYFTSEIFLLLYF